MGFWKSSADKAEIRAAEEKFNAAVANHRPYRDGHRVVCHRGQGWTDEGWRAQVAANGGPVPRQTD